LNLLYLLIFAGRSEAGLFDYYDIELKAKGESGSLTLQKIAAEIIYVMEFALTSRKKNLEIETTAL